MTQRNSHGKTRIVYLPEVPENIVDASENLGIQVFLEVCDDLVCLYTTYDGTDFIESCSNTNGAPRHTLFKLMSRILAMDIVSVIYNKAKSDYDDCDVMKMARSLLERNK